MVSRWLRAPSRVYLIGIGGVGMAGLARLLHQAGCGVSGSDSGSNRLTRDLEALGIRVRRGHAVSNVNAEFDWAIRTPAVSEDNPEVEALRRRGIPVFARGEVLAAYSRTRRTLAVAGAHGKTTTSAMLAHVLRRSGIPTGYAVGGETAMPGRVADAGESGYFVCEADESDGTLALYAPEVTVLTHVEWDHVERFRSEAGLLDCYLRVVERSGTVWIREDDALAEKLCAGHADVRRLGRSAAADLRLVSATDDPEGQRIQFQSGEKAHEFRLELPGVHNAWNALMAIAVAGTVGVEPRAAAEALNIFEGVARRFQKRTVAGVTVIQDYAHHPTEIRAVLESARALRPRKLWLVFQPHRFSRTRHLLVDFAESFLGADSVSLLPVYAASEVPEQGMDSSRLAEACRERGVAVALWPTRAAAARELANVVSAGELVLIAGAGDVENLQDELCEILKQRLDF
jgi:UDP-N-acetylmuramate--alanine ligase